MKGVGLFAPQNCWTQLSFLTLLIFFLKFFGFFTSLSLIWELFFQWIQLCLLQLRRILHQTPLIFMWVEQIPTGVNLETLLSNFVIRWNLIQNCWSCYLIYLIKNNVSLLCAANTREQAFNKKKTKVQENEELVYMLGG